MELRKEELIELHEKLSDENTPLVMFSIGADTEKQDKLAMFNYHAVAVELDFFRTILSMAIQSCEKNEG